MDGDMAAIRAMAERKLRQHTLRMDRDLRMILGHVELLDHIDGCTMVSPPKAQSTVPVIDKVLMKPSTTSNLAAENIVITEIATDLERATTQLSSEKDTTLISTVEVDEDFLSDDDDDDDESWSDEDEINKFYNAFELALTRAESPHHAPPTFVEEGFFEESVPASGGGASFRESVCEVCDGD